MVDIRSIETRLVRLPTRRTHKWTGLTAVSYTHLRAHETVLDLVCRLLLEKKKSDTTSVISLSEISNNAV